jgi:hypothetical protein
MTEPFSGGAGGTTGRGGAAHLALTLAIVVAASVAIAWPWLSGAVTVPWDAKAHFYPQLSFLAQSIGAGESPFWNPYIFAGWPQVADPQSLIFVPVMLALALVEPNPSFVAMDATLYGLLVLGGISLLLFFRDRGWHVAAGTVAALSFAFGGSAAWRIQHTGQVLSYALVPIVLLLLTRALDRRSVGYGLAAGLVAGFMALGRDQIALLAIYMLAGWTAVRLLSAPKPFAALRGTILPLGAGAVGGILVVAVPVVLTLLLAGDSNRPTIDFEGAGRASLPPQALITAVISDLFGQGDPDVHFWGPPSVAFGVTDLFLAQNMVALYAGALPVWAILLRGVARLDLFRREILFFTIFAALTIFYAIGWYTPVFHWMYDLLPGVKLYRRPADATFMIGFEIALIGGYLVHRWITVPSAPASLVVRALQWAIAATVLIAIPIAFALRADRLAEAAKPMLVGIAFAAAAVAVLAALRPLAKRSTVAAVALAAAFTAFDLHWNNYPNESTAYPPEVYDSLRVDTRDPVVTFLKERVAADAKGDRRDRVELTGLGFHWPNAGMVHRLENVLGYNPLRFATYQQATGARDTVALPDQREFSPLFPSYSSTMADLLGLRWIASSVPLTTIDPRLDPNRIVEAKWLGDRWIYENKGALPRVLFVDGVKPADFSTLLADGRWPERFDPRREVVLEADRATARPPGEGPAGTASITAYHNTSVEIAVDAARPGYLVLNDVWHPWWRAEVDGRAVPILKANAIFRAVPVEAGRHVVRFSFHPFAGALAQLRGMKP